MARILYFDCFSGAAGDMILGALIDAGLPFAALREALGRLALDGAEVTCERVSRGGIAATKFGVAGEPPPDDAAGHMHGAGDAHAHGRTDDHRHGHGHPHHHDATGAEHAHGAAVLPHAHRTVAEILRLIDGAALGPAARERAHAMVHRLAAAEAAIHQMPIEQVHLHEVGAIDSIVDIVGAAFAFDWFGADRVIVSALNVGGGMVRSAHGVIPVPAPATLRLLGDAPIYAGEVKKELLTPTGALVLTTYATAFGDIPRMRVTATGYGAGDRDLPGTPNVVRVLVGESDDSASSMQVVVLECEIDDMNPQIFGVLMDRLVAAGALDVFYVPVQMKKGRPGTLVTIVAPPARRAALAETMFRETTTIGIRYAEMARECLSREIVSVVTPLGPVRFKLARRDGAVLNASPEFDDVARIASEHGLPVKAVQAVAMKAYLGHQG